MKNYLDANRSYTEAINNVKQQQAQQESSALGGLLNTGITAAATVFGGPIGGAVASQITKRNSRYGSYGQIYQLSKRKEAAGIVNPEEERQIHDESVARQAEENAREQLPLRPTVAVQNLRRVYLHPTPFKNGKMRTSFPSSFPEQKSRGRK